MKIIQAFPSPVIVDFIEKRVDQLDIPNQKFVRVKNQVQGQYTTLNQRILKDYPRVEKIFLEAFKKVPLEYKNDFRITTSWCTKMEKGLYSQYHNHKNTYWSGVFYPEESDGKIEFKNPCMNLTSFFIVPEEFNAYNSSSLNVTPEKNMIVFFPSYLEHRVCAHTSEEPRYSLAFNIIPIGNYGEGDSSIFGLNIN